MLQLINYLFFAVLSLSVSLFSSFPLLARRNLSIKSVEFEFVKYDFNCFALYSTNSNENDGNIVTDNIKSAELSELFERIRDIKEDQVPQDIMNEINIRIKEGAPNEFEIRMQMMGITPLTKAGFALAGILITLNTILGSGWLGDIFGMNNENSLVIVRDNDQNDKSSMKFDYKQFRNNLDDIDLNNKPTSMQDD